MAKVNSGSPKKRPTIPRGWAVLQKLLRRDISRHGLRLPGAAKVAGMSKNALRELLRRDYKRYPFRSSLDRLAEAPWAGTLTRKWLARFMACIG